MTSKTNIPILILHIIITACFSFFMIIAVISTIKDLQHHEELDYFLILVIILGVLLSIVYFFYNLTSFQKIHFTKTDLVITGLLEQKRYQWVDVVEVNLFKRERTPILTFEFALVLNLINGKKIVIINDHYINVNDLRCFIFENFQNKIIDLVSKTDYESHTLKYKRRAFHGSVLHLLFSIIMAGVFINLMIGWKIPILGLFLIIIIVFIVLTRFGNELNYIVVMNNEILIKNYVWVWRNIKFQSERINQIIIENGIYTFMIVRIVSDNCKVYWFPISKLSKKKVAEFIDFMQPYNITINDKVKRIFNKA